MKSNILNILKKELKETFRDKKSLSMMLIIPIMIPLLVFGMSYLFESEVNKSVDEYNKIGFSYELSNAEESIAKEMKIKPTISDKKTLKREYNKGNINLYITKEGNKYIINGEENENSAYAITLINSYFAAYKEYLQTEYLANNNINTDNFINIISVEEKLEEKENFYASYITNYAFLFIIMAITVSATYPATDTTAGEKERKTLETLLTFPVKSKDIIIGKFLSVATSSIITGLISLILAALSLSIVGSKFNIFAGNDLTLTKETLLYAIIVIISFSLLISGLCIAIASKFKTFKEAQSALTPITFIAFFPGMIAYMTNLKTTPLLSMIPFLNYTMLFTDISSGTFNLLNILLMLISTIIVIAIILLLIIKEYKSEKVLFSN